MTTASCERLGRRFEHDGVNLAYDDLGDPSAPAVVPVPWAECDPHLLDGIDDLARIEAATWGDHDIETPIRGPVLVVRADPQLMPCFRPEDEQRFRRIAPQARFVAAEGSGHNIHEEQLDWFGDQVEAFLATV